MPESSNGYGSGSIYQRKDGYWVSAVSVNGKKIVSYSKTEKEAQRKLNEAIRQYHLGNLLAPTKVTVNDLTQHWLSAVSGDLKPTVVTRYEALCRLYIGPTLGYVKLHQLKPSHIVTALSDWRKRDVASGTVLNAYRCLHRALECAVKWGIIPRSPCDSVEAPRVKRREATVWSVDEAGRFLEASKETRYHTLWVFLSGTGCRLGEALGLKWADVDIESGVVQIRHNLVYVRGGWVEQDPKTKSSRRTIVLPMFAKTTLLAWRKRQLAERLAAGPEWKDTREAVFLTSQGTVPPHSSIRDAFVDACNKAGVRVCRRHDLRHLSATMLIASGVDPKTVQARLGHSTISMTMNLYAHAIQSRDRVAADALDDALAVAINR